MDDRELADTVTKVLQSDSEDIQHLIALSGLNTNEDFRYIDFRSYDFRNQNLAGINFSGSIINGANFEGAKISAATFDYHQADNLELYPAADYRQHVSKWLEASILNPASPELAEVRRSFLRFGGSVFDTRSMYNGLLKRHGK